MNKIYEFAIKSNQINADNIVKLISYLDEKQQAAATELAIGIHKSPNFRQYVTVDGEERTFIGYNPLNDRVDYSIEKEFVKYFKTEGKRDLYESTGNCARDYDDKESEAYPFKASRVESVRDWCYLPSNLYWVEQ